MIHLNNNVLFLNVCLQFPRLKDHMNTIGIDKSVINGASFKHKCLNNIKKIYQHAGKCDDQQNLKDILEAPMVSTQEEITDNIPSLPMTQKTIKKLSFGKPLRLFTNTFGVKKRTAICCVGAKKSKSRSIKSGCGLWKNKTKWKGYSKINEQIKHKLYTWITCHPQIVQPPISNDFLKVIFDDQTEPQIVLNVLTQVYVI